MAEALYASEPKSEWRVFDEVAAAPAPAPAVASTSTAPLPPPPPYEPAYPLLQRFAAAPDAIAAALPAGVALRTEPHDPQRAAAAALEAYRQPSTQVLVRFRADTDNPELLLDGRVSTADPVTGVHTLPAFREKEAVVDDGTRRSVPAPVVVGCVVEEGARVPSVVKVQLVQRTFVDGAQVDEGYEAIVSETELDAFVTGDPRARVCAIGYPARFTRGPYLTIVDKYKLRRRAEDRDRGLLQAFGRLGKAIFRQRASNIYRAFDNLTNMAANNRVLITSGALLAVATALAGYTLPFGITVATGLYLIERSVLKFLSLAYRLIAGSPSTAKPDDHFEVDVDIPLVALPALLNRIVGYNTAGSSSNRGRPWTFEELRKASRVHDAVVLEYFQNVVEGTITDAQDMEDGLVALARADARRANVAITDAQIQEVRDYWNAFWRLWRNDVEPNRLELHGLQRETLENAGYVEFDLRVIAVGQREHTFTMRSPNAARAGWFASGGEEALAALDRAVEKITDDLNNAVVPLHQSPVVFAELTGNARDDAVNYLAGARQAQLQASSGLFRSRLAMFLKQIKDALTDADTGAGAKPTDVPNAAPAAGTVVRHVLRALPHRVVRARTLVPTAWLQMDGGVDYASENAPIGTTRDGIGQAISACNGARSVVSRTADQFFERDAVSTERLRLLQRIAIRPADFPDPLQVRRAVALPLPHALRLDAELPVRSRSLYVPRQPFGVVRAVETYAEHPRVSERTRIGWLTRPMRGDASADAGGGPTETWAALLGTGTSHADELVAYAFLDLVCTDIVHRQTVGARAQLMASPEAFASEQLRAAAALVADSFDAEATPPTRIEDGDGFYACYPGGEALRRALCESPVWRAWAAQRPASGGGESRAARLARAYAAPAPPATTHLATLAAALRRGGAKLEAKGCALGMPYESAPHLGVQTLVLGHRRGDGRPATAIGQIEAAWAALARVHALCTALGPFGLTASRRASALVEAAAARPILAIALAAKDSPTPGSSPPELVAILDRPFGATLAAAAVQPDLVDARLATSITSAGVVGLLQDRLARMRLDVEAVAAEPFETNAASALAARMRQCALTSGDAEDACTFLVPFAAGDPPALHPDLFNACAFDQTPVFAGAVLDRLDAMAQDQAVLLGAAATTPCTIACREVDDDRPRPPHPMQIRTTAAGASGPTVEVNVVFGSVGAPPDPTTLAASVLAADTLDAVTRNAQLPGRGSYVESASALLWTIERLVQGFLVAAAAFDGTNAVHVPPPDRLPAPQEPIPPMPPRAAVDAKVAEADRMRKVMVALMVMHYGDMAPAQLGSVVNIDGTRVDLNCLVVPPGGDETAASFNDEAATGAPALSPTPLPEDASMQPLLEMDVDGLNRALDVLRRRGYSENDFVQQAKDEVDDYMRGVLSDDRLERLRIYVESHAYYQNQAARLNREYNQSRAAVVSKRARVRWRNLRTKATEARRYESTLRLWPCLVATAATIAAANLDAGSVAVVDIAVGATQALPMAPLRAAVSRVRDGGVKAVPLCEWVAALARTIGP